MYTARAYPTTVIDLAKSVKWEDVQRAINYHYQKDSNDYEGLFVRLQNEPKKKHKDLKEMMVLRLVEKSEFNDEPYYFITTNKYSLSLRKWSEVMNIPLSPTTLKHYSPVDIIAHFLWEITFYGPETEFDKLLNEMKYRCEECK